MRGRPGRREPIVQNSSVEWKFQRNVKVGQFALIYLLYLVLIFRNPLAGYKIVLLFRKKAKKPCSSVECRFFFELSMSFLFFVTVVQGFT